MHLAWFVSSHGLGHAARTAAIVSSLPAEVRVTIVADFDRDFFRRRFPDRTSWRPGRFDVGCVQTDTLTIDRGATLAAAAAVEQSNAAHAASWSDWLRENACDAVVTDIAAFPVELAENAGLPAFVVANFTWCSIYRAWSDSEPLVALLASAYSKARRAFVPGPACPMPEFIDSETLPWVAARGLGRRKELSCEIGASAECIALVLPGAWGTPFRGMPDTGNSWRFVSLGPAPTSLPEIVALDPLRWRHEDVVASVDVVLGKPGYGTVGECALAGTPMGFVRRPDFAESRVLEDWMEANGLGMPIERDDYLACRWSDAIDRLMAMPKPMPVAADGARLVGQAILDAIEGTRSARAESFPRDVNDHVRNSSEEKR